MTASTLIRLRENAKQTEVLALVAEARMSNGSERATESVSRKSSCVEYMAFRLNGRVVAEVFLGSHIAVSPLTVVAIERAKPGDRADVIWRDRLGGGGSGTASVE
jgi:hypothetical protein